MKQQQGRSMIEMLAVVMIIGILTVGAIAGLNQAMDKYRVGKMHNDIMSMDSEITNLYAWMRGYPYGTTKSTPKNITGDLCDNEVFDDCDQNQPKNPYGGNYVVTTVYDSKTITTDGLSVDVCNDLKVQEWGQYASNISGCATGCGNSCTFSITFE